MCDMDKKERDFRDEKLPIPVGKSDWKEVAGHCYCVDKTLLMCDLLAMRAGVAIPNRELEQVYVTDIMKFGYAFYAKKSAIRR